ncbi:MAG TPA: hypothetical protein VE965_05860 [Gammaproteobacteria bacterium]|jgi:hypothetical protein|nr:hypothetical protein [Gammaproteobacteria bacterium]
MLTLLEGIKAPLLEKVPVSQVGDELGIAPSLFYRWQAKLFEHAEQALNGSR